MNLRTGGFVRKSDTARRHPKKGKHYFPRITLTHQEQYDTVMRCIEEELEKKYETRK